MSSPESQTLPTGYLEQYRGQRLIITATIFLVIDVVFVGLRFFARRHQRQKLNWDDWILIPSFISILGTIIASYLAVVHGGVGHHVMFVAQHRDMLVYWYKACMVAIPITTIISVALPKMSILGLYLHILRDKPSRLVVYGTFFAITVNCTVMLVLLIYKCYPISYGWRSLQGEHIPGGWCVNPQPRFIWASFVNIITDVIMMILPIPLLWRIQMNRVSKLGLSIIFGLGGVGIVTSCMRFAAFFGTAALVDPSWTAVVLLIWCIVEPSIYLMAACSLSFGHLTTKLFEKMSFRIFQVRSRRSGRGKTSDRSTTQHVSEKSPGKARSLFTLDKSLFSTRISTVQIGSASSGDTAFEDECNAYQKGIIRIQQTFDIESQTTEASHDEHPHY